jgi:hypothetical protein
VLLRWDAAALGPDPARRLPGDLTPTRAAMLAACCDTGTAAAAALCLHLNHGTTHLGQLAISDIAPDGSALLRDRPRQPGTFARPQAGTGRDSIALAELADGELVRIPACARPVIAAHLAYRLGQGAAVGDPFFIHPRSPAAAAQNASCATPSPGHARPSDTPRRGSTATTAGTEPTSASPPASRDGWPSGGCRCT